MLEAVQQSIYICWLVVSTPLKNISQLGLWFPIYGKNKKCSKPPTRLCFEHILRMRILCTHFYGFVRPFPPMIKESAVVSTLSSPSAAKLRLVGRMPQELSFDLERCRGWESHRTPAPAFSWSLRLESSGFFNGFWVIQFLESAQVH